MQERPVYGTIADFDTHDNLLNNNELYKALYESQTVGGEV